MQLAKLNEKSQMKLLKQLTTYLGAFGGVWVHSYLCMSWPNGGQVWKDKMYFRPCPISFPKVDINVIQNKCDQIVPKFWQKVSKSLSVF